MHKSLGRTGRLAVLASVIGLAAGCTTTPEMESMRTMAEEAKQAAAEARAAAQQAQASADKAQATADQALRTAEDATGCCREADLGLWARPATSANAQITSLFAGTYGQ